MKGVVAILMLAVVTPCTASDPACDGINNWAAAMTFTHLKNAGITSNDKIDFDRTKVKRLASEKIGEDLYHQIHLVTYVEKSGKEIEAITSNNASSEECSMSGVKIYVIKNKLGDECITNACSRTNCCATLRNLPLMRSVCAGHGT